MAKNKKIRLKMSLRKDDLVKVISGIDSTKTGKILKVLPTEGKIVVEGVNVAKKHSKPRPPKVPQGGILEKAMPISAGKVMLVCPKCNKPVRVKKVANPEGKFVRVCRKCGDSI